MISHPAIKTTKMEDCIYSYICSYCKRTMPGVMDLPATLCTTYCRKKKYFQAAGLHQNPKNSSSLFAFPHIFPIAIAPLWFRPALLHTVCQRTRKWEPCAETLPGSVASARTDTPCPPQFTSHTHNPSPLCVRARVQPHR